MHTAITDGLASGADDIDHGPLHDVGRVLEDTESMINQSEMDDETKKKLLEAVEQLFDAYGAVDAKLHDATKGKDFADVSDQIEAAISALKAEASIPEEK